MKTIMRYLICLALAITAAPTSRPQSAAHELRLSDIRAQQTQEKIFASAPCQRALQDQAVGWQRYKADPTTFVENLNTLMEISDEVILAGVYDAVVVLSPTGQSVTTYNEVRVVRSWKGPHHIGDLLMFGVPYGSLTCELSPEGTIMHRFAVDGPYFSRANLYVLFLRQPKGDETKLVRGLFPAAGEGAQGIFQIPVTVPLTINAEDYCVGLADVNAQHCEAIMQTSQSPVVVPYAHDPLAKKYSGMPASDFLREVQSVAAVQGVAEKSSSK
jgi:hypothetical protein